MESNDFRHLYDNGCSKEVSVLLCLVKFVAWVLFRCSKKNKTNDIKKLGSFVLIVSSNNKSEDSVKG